MKKAEILNSLLQAIRCREIWGKTIWIKTTESVSQFFFSSPDSGFLGIWTAPYVLCACVSLPVWMYGAYLEPCTGRHRHAWHCTGVNCSDCTDQGTHTRFRGKSRNEVAGPSLPPVLLSRLPSAACPESWHHSSPARHLVPWGRNGQVTHRLTQTLLNI